eukprot:254929_1
MSTSFKIWLLIFLCPMLSGILDLSHHLTNYQSEEQLQSDNHDQAISIGKTTVGTPPNTHIITLWAIPGHLPSAMCVPSERGKEKEHDPNTCIVERINVIRHEIARLNALRRMNSYLNCAMQRNTQPTPIKLLITQREVETLWTTLTAEKGQLEDQLKNLGMGYGADHQKYGNLMTKVSNHETKTME